MMSEFLYGMVSGMVVALVVAAVYRCWEDGQRRQWTESDRAMPPVVNPWSEEEL